MSVQRSLYSIGDTLIRAKTGFSRSSPLVWFRILKEFRNRYLEGLWDHRYYLLRPRILQESRITVPCEVCTVLKALVVIGADIASTPTAISIASSMRATVTRRIHFDCTSRRTSWNSGAAANRKEAQYRSFASNDPTGCTCSRLSQSSNLT